MLALIYFTKIDGAWCEAGDSTLYNPTQIKTAIAYHVALGFNVVAKMEDGSYQPLTPYEPVDITVTQLHVLLKWQ